MIYENICKLAKERGISINKLEEKANVSTGSICKWGNSVSPTVKNIKKVADILKCTVDELISATDETGSEEGRELKVAESVSVLLVSIAAVLTAIDQISIVLTTKKLWRQQQQLQQQLEMLQKELSEL